MTPYQEEVQEVLLKGSQQFYQTVVFFATRLSTNQTPKQGRRCSVQEFRADEMVGKCAQLHIYIYSILTILESNLFKDILFLSLSTASSDSRFHRNRRSFSENSEKLSISLSRDIGSNPNQGMKSHLIAVASMARFILETDHPSRQIIRLV